ncbi:MAG TPA: hypothetical protein VIT23_03825, partial [Terrimicrobiaceae bacterium]
RISQRLFFVKDALKTRKRSYALSFFSCKSWVARRKGNKAEHGLNQVSYWHARHFRTDESFPGWRDQ